MNSGPIIIVDDDSDDLEMLQRGFTDLNLENEIIVFDDGNEFLEYVRKTTMKTFFILCDINMPRIGGLELKRKIYEDERLRLKCVPFIFLSTSGGSKNVMDAYSFGVQGYFVKPSNYTAMKEMLLRIVNYWSDSQHPNR